MKKLNILALILFVGIAFVSCDKSDESEIDLMLKASVTEGPSGLTSFTGVVPQIIPGANKGGNRTCAEVGIHFKKDPAYFDYCGDKVDFEYFSGGFPEGLNVTSDGKYLVFKAEDCILIGDKYYKVGAVIVKGSNAANVYFYKDGTMGDSRLTAPVNASGRPAGISNVTFCFVECEEQPELVIAFKGYFVGGKWACTVGGPDEIKFVAYYDFVPGFVGNVYLSANTAPSSGDLSKPVGKITVEDIDDDGLLEVIIDNFYMPTMLYNKGYLFVGTFEDYDGLYYTLYPSTGLVTPTAELIFDMTF